MSYFSSSTSFIQLKGAKERTNETASNDNDHFYSRMSIQRATTQFALPVPSETYKPNTFMPKNFNFVVYFLVKMLLYFDQQS